MVSYLYMTTRRIVSLSALFLLLFVAMPAAAAEQKAFSLSVANVTMVPVPPTCEARATKKVIRSGGSVDIVWKSRGAEKMVGLVKGDDEWPVDGRERVSIAVLGKHVFPMTFIAKSGATRTCTATVFVHPRKK